MASKGDWEGIEIRRNKRGEITSYRVRAAVGSGDKLATVPPMRFEPGTDVLEMKEWRLNAQKDLKAAQHLPGSFAAAIDTFFLRVDPKLSKRNEIKKRQQFAFWSMQPIKLDAPVLTVRDVIAQSGGSKGGKTAGRYGVIPAAKRVDHGKTIGQSPIRDLKAARVRQILSTAFAPTDPDKDPTEFAATSNHYLSALKLLFSILNRDQANKYDPAADIDERTPPAPSKVGQDLRVVAEILKHLGPKGPRGNGKGRERLIPFIEVLAFTPLCPVQLFRLEREMFRDMPQATRQQQIDGEICVMRPARDKGRRRSGAPKKKPTLMPLVPRGIAAMRRMRDDNGFALLKTFADDNSFSSTLNRIVRDAAQRAYAALLADGVKVDGLQNFTLYNLKHSLAAFMFRASAGLLDADGELKMDEGVQESFDHASPEMTMVYTEAEATPLRKLASKRTALAMDELFKTPLRPARPLALVG